MYTVIWNNDTHSSLVLNLLFDVLDIFRYFGYAAQL